MTGPQPHRDYAPHPSLPRRILTVVIDLAKTAFVVALAYWVAVGLAELIV